MVAMASTQAKIGLLMKNSTMIIPPTLGRQDADRGRD